MTKFDQEVELVAETLWQSEYVRATGKQRSISWGDNLDETQERYRFCARAVLAALTGRDKFAVGCCSSVSPCDHQKRSPYTICEVCERAQALTSS